MEYELLMEGIYMKKGFTLSEVLITLGILGVVAVLTIPGAMRNYQNRMYVSKLQKTYTQISDALQEIMNDEHVDNYYETSAAAVTSNDCKTDSSKCTEGLGYFLNKYFKVTKRMESTSVPKDSGFFTGSYKSLNGTSLLSLGSETQYCIQTTDGAMICGFHNTGNNCTCIIVDINGNAGPNVAGRDVFSMDIHKSGVLSNGWWGCVLPPSSTSLSSCTNVNDNGLYKTAGACAQVIMQAGWKMEY